MLFFSTQEWNIDLCHYVCPFMLFKDGIKMIKLTAVQAELTLIIAEHF